MAAVRMGCAAIVFFTPYVKMAKQNLGHIAPGFLRFVLWVL